MPQGRDDSAASRTDRAIWCLTGLLAFLLTLLVGTLSWSRQGNLAWDDADYLRSALRIVDRAEARGPLGTLPGVMNGLLKERPKPPLLVGWICAERMLLGKRDDLRPLIVGATALPFALLAAAVMLVAGRLAGSRSALFGIALLGGSPLALAFGAKVMVETFMALWVLLTLACASALLARPSRNRAIACGATLGLAMLTKLTFVLLLALPLLAFVGLFVRRHGCNRSSSQLATTTVLVALVVAGPWYARNGKEAVRFAAWSSRYQQVAEDRSDVVPIRARLNDLASQVSGWPNLGGLGLAVLAWTVSVRRSTRAESEPDSAGASSSREIRASFSFEAFECRDFLLLTGLGLIGGVVTLLGTSYFDPRFLLPIWGATAASGAILVGQLRARRLRWAIAGLSVAGLTVAVGGLPVEPRNRTYWGARALIDELVARYQIKTLGNLGNCADWNVSKTGLMNELRKTPEDCFVLLDVSQWTPDDLARRLGRVDAVVVLDEQVLTPTIRASAPGLNRAFEPARERLEADVEFQRVAIAPADLPPLSVYVRRR